LSKRPKKDLKSAANGEKAAPAASDRSAVPPKKILIFGGGAAALIIVVLLIYFVSPSKKTPPAAPLPQTNAAALSPGSVPEQPGVSPLRLSGDDRKDFPAIWTIRLEPPQPTRMDTLKAEVLTDSPDPGRFTYTYAWKVNDRKIEGASEDTLDLSTCQKGDLITVIVTPHDGDKAGFSEESPVAAVHGIPPSLDLKTMHQARKAGKPVELQLVSLHPDSAGVAFTLEPPLVEGMSIDNQTGKITWFIRPDQRGTIRFGAAVEDTDKTKVAKVFDIVME
jgi:hypothetical protein